ncbi:M56 family metallopeptidase [Azospirillum sp. B506]|uniref:M56 family metallopeptidase n=1 Tax=Azospirillum sp. B506 TaxID=137721 RepID=UPI00131F19EA|nr:M56 family metallopeptidase [Azospirillum sp. B506]
MANLLGGVLLDFLWKGAMIGAVAAFLLRALRHADPRSRYAVLCGTLVLCALLPAVQLCRGWMSVAAVGGRIGTLDVRSIDAGPSWPVPMDPDWLPWLAEAWLAGVAVMAARLVVGLFWVRHAVKSSQSWSDPQWDARLSQLMTRLELPRSVGFRITHTILSPVTAGWWRPVVLVPAGLLARMPPDLLEAVLAHELAHIRRFDYLVNLLQTVIEVLLFFHPIVWWLSRRIRVERERIADDIAGRLIGSPRRLANALDRLSRLQQVPASDWIAQPARGGDLVDRIRRLVSPPPRPSGRSMVVPIAAAGILPGALGAWLFWSAVLAPAITTTAGSPAGGDGPMLAGIEAFIDRIGPANLLVVDETSGDRLMHRGEDSVVPIASLTKLMMAMVVLDAKPDFEMPIQIERQDADATRGGTSQLPVGAQMPFQTLLRLALMASDNRAAHALARSYPGGAQAFGRSMQDKISTLGLRNTTLADPTGLSPDNRSTASEMGRIVAAAAGYAEITRDTTQVADRVIVDGAPLDYRNTNPLVGQQGWDILLSKTGFSDAAGRCLIMRVRSEGRDLTIVLLNGHPKPA